MNNITHKVTSLRKAVATAIVKTSSQETIDAILHKRVPKGDVFEFSRAAGLLGIKKTSDLIPDCHPLPVEYAAIRHTVDGLNIIIEVEVHTIYRTGVEVEAMHDASITPGMERVSSGSMASGVTSLGDRPVPPVKRSRL